MNQRGIKGCSPGVTEKPVDSSKFVLDGSNNPKELYTRGPDLSGTLSGAGGIGGILACTYSSGPVLYHHADLMGNIIALTDTSGPVRSSIRYAPFGQPLSCNVLSRFLFSSKELEISANLIYYGRRYYAIRQGRWLNRDPNGAASQANLYEFVKNNTHAYFDPDGMQDIYWPLGNNVVVNVKSSPPQTESQMGGAARSISA